MSPLIEASRSSKLSAMLPRVGRQEWTPRRRSRRQARLQCRNAVPEKVTAGDGGVQSSEEIIVSRIRLGDGHQATASFGEFAAQQERSRPAV